MGHAKARAQFISLVGRGRNGTLAISMSFMSPSMRGIRTVRIRYWQDQERIGAVFEQKSCLNSIQHAVIRHRTSLRRPGWRFRITDRVDAGTRRIGRQCPASKVRLTIKVEGVDERASNNSTTGNNTPTWCEPVRTRNPFGSYRWCSEFGRSRHSTSRNSA